MFNDVCCGFRGHGTLRQRFLLWILKVTGPLRAAASTVKQDQTLQPTHSLLRRLLVDYVRPHIRRLLAAATCMALVAATTGLTAWLLQPAIDEIFIARSQTLLFLLPLAVVVVALVKGIAAYGQGVLMSGVGQSIIAETQLKMYSHLIRADLAYLHDMHTGKMLSSFLFDATLLRDAVGRAITGMVKDFLTVVALATVMFAHDWRLALISLLTFPLAGLAIRKLGRRLRKVSTRTQEETGRLATHLTETLEGVRLVKAYGMEARETERARDAINRRLAQIMKEVRTRSASAPITEALGGLAVAMAIIYGGWQAQAGDLSIGAFTSFLAALLLAYQPVKSLATLNNALQEGLAAAQRIFAVLDVEPAIQDAPDAAPLRFVGGGIEFSDVRFAYDGEVPALSGVSLKVPAGAMVALVGPSGAGKSTLMNLIPRLYDADSGQVMIDGQDVKSLELDSLRRHIAVVSQETTLFDDTVRANIAYGRLDADDDEVMAAARAAGVDEFAGGLSRGYDTVVGEKGVKLSGGQRQRLAIARAMLRDAPILLLDEATSSLDSETERQVQEALGRLMKGRTTMVIAHRLSTVVAADVIYVLEDGRVVEAGDHGELMARGGRYAGLYSLQFSDAQDDGRITRIGT